MSKAEEMKKYRKEHPEYVEIDRARKKEIQDSRQVWVYHYLKDHPSVTGLFSCSVEPIMTEIEKCEVCCANCHSRITAKRANTIRWRLSKEKS